MRPEDRDAAHLWDMLQAAREVREIVGESALRVSPVFAEAHPEIPWRNIIAHEYGQIDHELLYRTVVDDVPDLIRKLDALVPSNPAD